MRIKNEIIEEEVEFARFAFAGRKTAASSGFLTCCLRNEALPRRQTNKQKSTKGSNMEADADSARQALRNRVFSNLKLFFFCLAFIVVFPSCMQNFIFAHSDKAEKATVRAGTRTFWGCSSSKVFMFVYFFLSVSFCCFFPHSYDLVL